MLNPTEMTVQLNPAAIATLNEMAQRQQRSEGAIIEDALNDYFRYIADLEAKIEKGREDIRAGRFLTQEEVEEKFRKLGIDID